MVEFKSWKDTYMFLLKYGKFSCLNCKKGGHNLDLTADNSEFTYSHLFCNEWVSMVDFAFQFVCERWTDGETSMDDVDKSECPFDLSDEVLEVLSDPNNGKWTIEEVDRLVEHDKLERMENGCEEVSE